MEERLLIRNGYIVDPDTGFEGNADLLVQEGVILERGRKLPCGENTRVIEAGGLCVMPGLVDLHVHLRDPGQTWKEDIRSAGAAAVCGGVTTMLAMPNTSPPVDSADRIRDVCRRAREETASHVVQACAVTKEMLGRELVDIDALISGGHTVFSEDGKSVMSTLLLREALGKFASGGALFCDHCEEIGLVSGGVMNEDANAGRLGLPGIPGSAEDTITARDIVLAAEAGARLHLCHVSTAGAVKIVRAAKREGVKVTAEVCPHHFILTSDDIPGDDADYKMNPPLRTPADRRALIEGLKDGTIDCISTDHAPHSREEKARGFLKAPFGIVGLETSAALTYTYLVKPGILTLREMAEKMSRNPAAVLGVPGGSLAPGAPADIAVFDFETSHVIDPERFASRGKNTPFKGMEVYGTVKYTIVGGKTVWEEKT